MHTARAVHEEPGSDVTRQFAHFTGRTENKTKTFTQKMREKIDSVAGKLISGRRMAAVEPVFADIHRVSAWIASVCEGKRR